VTWWIAQKCGVTINHKAVLRLMNQLGIHSVARKRRIYKNSQLETYHSYPNLLNRDFTATRANQKWVTDVTYILTHEGWAYLSTIKDLYDNFIVAHQFGRENSVALVQQNLRKAKQKEKVTDGLVLHSDQGQQYTSQAYFVLTHEYNITASMSRRAHCLKLNVTIESIVASRRMLPYGRSFCNAGGEHDESTQQARVARRDPTTLSESKESREENDAG
jgi:transposase InsO family protein